MPEEHGAERRGDCPREHPEQSRGTRRRHRPSGTGRYARRGRCSKRARKFRGTGKAIGRQLGERHEHGGLDVLRHRIAQHVQGRRLFTQHLGHDGLHVAAQKRRIAGQHFVRDRTQRVEVAAGVDGALAHRLLGAHVLRRAEAQSSLRHALAGGALHSERDTEVGDECAAIVQENVLRLDVAMNDVLAMCAIERTGDFACDAHRVGKRQLSFALHSCAQRFAGHERHHVVQQPVSLSAVKQRQNVRMLKARSGANLGQKPLTTEGRAQTIRWRRVIAHSIPGW